jgi:uncharacterized OB-fold protein
MSELPLPEITALTAPYWDALKKGSLVFQGCACGKRWLPARRECPNCLREDQWRWQPASGRGRLISWVVYHTAYHPAFAAKTPYNVAIVELEEGPRLISNIEAANDSLKGDMPVRLQGHTGDGFPLTRFIPG